MSKLKTVFNMFDNLFNGNYDAFQFSLDMEEFLFDNFEALQKENKKVSDILENDVPDLCSEGEPGFDSTHMIAELKKVYEKAKVLYKKAE